MARTSRTDRQTLRPNGRRMGRPRIRTASTSRAWFLALRDWGCLIVAAAARLCTGAGPEDACEAASSVRAEGASAARVDTKP